MKHRIVLFAKAVAFCLVIALPSRALVGAGIQWGFDLTLDMKDSFNKPVLYTQFQPSSMLDDTVLNLGTYLPVGITVDSIKQLLSDNETAASSLPFTLSRSGWSRSVINFGGKVFIDAIPIIDAVEVSFNMGAWEYEALLKYPLGTAQDNITPEDVEAFAKTGNYEMLLEMGEMPLTLEEFDLGYLKLFGISKTPYFRAHIDALVRKNLFALPKKLKIFRMYLGGGMSLHLGTPILTPSFVMDVLDSPIKTAIAKGGTAEEFSKVSPYDMKRILESLIEQSKTPTFGLNFIGGVMIKMPIIPVGVFADAKYLLPLGDLDKYVDIGGRGFLINAGICISL